MSIKTARKEAKLTQNEMSKLFEIPKRTIESWETNERSCPKWAEKMIIKSLNGVKESRVLFTDWTVERLCIAAKNYNNKNDFITSFCKEPWTEEFDNEKVNNILEGIWNECK